MRRVNVCLFFARYIDASLHWMRQATSPQKIQNLSNSVTRQLSDSVSLKKSRSDDSSQAGGGVRSTEPLHSWPEDIKSAEGTTEVFFCRTFGALICFKTFLAGIPHCVLHHLPGNCRSFGAVLKLLNSLIPQFLKSSNPQILKSSYP